MNNPPLIRIILFTMAAAIAAIGIFFNLKLLLIINIFIVLGLLFLINRKK